MNEAISEKKTKEKKSFKMPHLLWVMFSILLLASLATYIIPAGEFATTSDGTIIGDQFKYLSTQTPVSPWDMMMLILDGLTGSASIIFVVMAAGAAINVFFESGSINNILNWAIYKLQDKGLYILISLLFILITYVGGFAGSDALIALVPIGVLFSKKLKLDPIVAIGVITFPALLGFGTGPRSQYVSQLMIGIRPYSGFGMRFLFMNVFMVFGLIYLLYYVRKIQKDPTKSLMWDDGWRPDEYAKNETDVSIEGEQLKASSVLALVIFIGQYLVIISYSLLGGASDQLYSFMIASHLLATFLIGLVTRMGADKTGNATAKGLSNMAFVAFVIGLARVMSLILANGNILDTIVYNLTLPLQSVSQSFATIGIAGIVAILNPLVPSVASKAAILIPILEPMGEALQINPQLIIQAFQFGDGFTNLVSPVLGWTVGSAIAAKVPFGKWIRWVLPAVIFFIVIGFVMLYILTAVGWTGGI